MSYRDDVDALSARHEALANEVAVKTRERDVASDLLKDARERARLPVLANIRVASPCKADWNQMIGDDRMRACGSCEKRVYNLSDMTRDEAEALIMKLEGKLCARYFQRSDGTILLKDCEVGAQGVRRRRWIAAGAVTLLAGGGASYLKLRPDTVTAASIDLTVTADNIDPDVATVHDPAAPRPIRDAIHATLGHIHEVKGDISMPAVEERYDESSGATGLFPVTPSR